MANTVAIEAGPSFAHQVSGGLWIGNAPAISSAHEANRSESGLSAFDTLVLCASEYQLDPSLFAVGEVIRAPMDDVFRPISPETATMAVYAAREVVVRLSEGETVLVTCLAGRNRSGLVCALALCFGPQRLSADDAVAQVRQARGDNALANPYFVRFVQSIAK